MIHQIEFPLHPLLLRLQFPIFHLQRLFSVWLLLLYISSVTALSKKCLLKYCTLIKTTLLLFEKRPYLEWEQLHLALVKMTRKGGRRLMMMMKDENGWKRQRTTILECEIWNSSPNKQPPFVREHVALRKCIHYLWRRKSFASAQFALCTSFCVLLFGGKRNMCRFEKREKRLANENCYLFDFISMHKNRRHSKARASPEKGREHLERLAKTEAVVVLILHSSLPTFSLFRPCTNSLFINVLSYPSAISRLGKSYKIGVKRDLEFNIRMQSIDR